MNETAECVRGDQTEQPKDDEDDRYCFKHLFFPFKSSFSDELFRPILAATGALGKAELSPLFLNRW
jgi:hypothetical protein